MEQELSDAQWELIRPWLHNFRRLVVRYGRKAHVCFGFVLLAFAILLTNRVLN